MIAGDGKYRSANHQAHLTRSGPTARWLAQGNIRLLLVRVPYLATLLMHLNTHNLTDTLP